MNQQIWFDMAGFAFPSQIKISLLDLIKANASQDTESWVVEIEWRRNSGCSRCSEAGDNLLGKADLYETFNICAGGDSKP